jgi:glycine cleavage system H protein
MSDVRSGLRYLKSHEWARLDADGTVVVGISDHAQSALGELVFVELPAVGKQLAAGAAAAVVESVKAASDVYSPVAGTVVEVNTAVSDSPETINGAPYDSGWMFKLKPANAADIDGLLDSAAYSAQL